MDGFSVRGIFLDAFAVIAFSFSDFRIGVGESLFRFAELLAGDEFFRFRVSVPDFSVLHDAEILI